MGLRDTIKQIAQETALQAVNYNSSAVQSQNQAQQAVSGLMIVQSVKNLSGQILLSVRDNSGNLQTIQYIGSDNIYPGLGVFCSNGFAQ